MNVLILGSGGREHAFAWKISQSEKIDDLYIAPGNAGTEKIGKNIDLNLTNFENIKQFVITNNINIVVVGPEGPLVEGISDFFKKNNELKDVGIIGPCAKGAILEGSKEFAKNFMLKYEIPTAAFKSFNKEQLNEGASFIDSLQSPYVLKADGLAAGKGVLIIDDKEKAKEELSEMLEGKFGDASKTVVIEEFLKGIELSVFVLTDGKSYKILPEAKDYKRIGEGDKGLNTGGMGAISPVPFANKTFMQKVEERIVKPTVRGLINEGVDYKGFIFIGLMKVNEDPYVIEYNVRMGDPEAEVVIPRIKSDIIDLFNGVINENLNDKNIEIESRTVSTVMLVSGGYPEDYEKGKIISNIDKTEGSILFHAGTKNLEENIITNGGRVIAVSSYGNNINEALGKSYANASVIDFEKKYFRKDIGFDLKD